MIVHVWALKYFCGPVHDWLDMGFSSPCFKRGSGSIATMITRSVESLFVMGQSKGFGVLKRSEMEVAARLYMACTSVDVCTHLFQGMFKPPILNKKYSTCCPKAACVPQDFSKKTRVVTDAKPSQRERKMASREIRTKEKEAPHSLHSLLQ
ncbi:hypothetical protein TNCV_807901 [Trichonephila clavipes]|nr:hypothetical protein TNCV_807901 [Trichonephila clavipes]